MQWRSECKKGAMDLLLSISMAYNVISCRNIAKTPTSEITKKKLFAQSKITYASAVNLRYLETIEVHPIRRQGFAGNISDIVIF